MNQNKVLSRTIIALSIGVFCFSLIYGIPISLILGVSFFLCARYVSGLFDKKEVLEVKEIPVRCPYFGFQRDISGQGMFFKNGSCCGCSLSNNFECMRVVGGGDIDFSKCSFNGRETNSTETVDLQRLPSNFENCGYETYSQISMNAYLEFMQIHPRTFTYKGVKD